MYYTVIFGLYDQISVISPAHSSLLVCLEFIKHFITQIEPNAIGFGCFSPEVLLNMGINPA